MSDIQNLVPVPEPYPLAPPTQVGQALGWTPLNAEEQAKQQAYWREQEEIQQARRMLEDKQRVRAAALDAAIRCFGVSASDWQQVVKAARDITLFLENG